MTCLLGLAAQSPNSPNTDVLLNRCVTVSTAAPGPVSNDPHLFIVCESFFPEDTLNWTVIKTTIRRRSFTDC